MSEADARALPAGHMIFYRRVRPIVEVEAWADEQMRGFDNLPPDVLAAINEVPLDPQAAGVLVARYGDRAAQIILTEYRAKVYGRRK